MVGDLRKKINIVTPIYPPRAGGIGSVAYYSAKTLSKKGFDVCVFVPNYGKKETEKEVFEGINVVRVKPAVEYGNAAFIPEVSRFLKNGDVVHLHYPFYGGAEVIHFYKKRLRLKIVLHYHMDVVGGGFKSIIFWIHKKLILPLIIKNADSVIVTSDDYALNSIIAKYYKQYRGKFFPIPIGVDTENYFPENPNRELMSKYNPEEKKVILFVGGLDDAHYFKGVRQLLEAVAPIEDILLFIVGDGNRKKSYESYAHDLGIKAKVKFFGKVPLEMLRPLYNMCTVFVLPSTDKSEAFGMVLTEAAACGKPVVASDLPGVRTVVDDGKSGLLAEPSNVEDLRKKIVQILSDDSLQRGFGHNGLKKVQKEYRWDVVAEKFIRLYER